MRSWSGASVNEIVEINPARVVFKISPLADLKGTVGGDWDIERRSLFSESVKARSIRQRFVKGWQWEETDLFRELYPRRFKRDPEIRGASTIEELLAQYYERIDALYHDIRTGGFRQVAQLPGLFVGRGGELFIGNQGNHRLAIAHVLGLKRIFAEIKCKHQLAP